ncbi:hypothetical protein [Streptomyces sp. NPDC050485]|uniref:hypothetical protein n=1 Tax=Streptomyces sp. NPDC050485 TaxID=3365617 RepID=UPI0037909B91
MDQWVDAVYASTVICMRGFGLAYSESVPPRGERLELTDRRYGLADVTRAQSLGFWLSTPGDDSTTDATATADETRVAYGGGGKTDRYRGKTIPEGGCYGQATRQISGGPDLTKDLDTANDVQLKSFKESRKTAQVKVAEQHWSACMKGKGHDLPADVFSAANSLHLPETRPRPAPGSAEVVMATDSARCIGQSDLFRTWFTAESAAQHKMIQADPGTFATLHDHIHYARTQTAKTPSATPSTAGRPSS